MLRVVSTLVGQTAFLVPEPGPLNPLHDDVGADRDCSIRFQRQPVPQLASRMVPAPYEDDMTLAWQDGESIFLQRFSNICDPKTGVVTVNSSHGFWEHPSSSGLGDAASVSRTRTAVAWVCGDGHVWVSLVDGDSAGAPVRVSGSGRWTRTDVKVAADRAHGTFFVAWSSWGQDGDGWGVYLRPFDDTGQPVDDEQQVNVVWRDLQWQPQLTVCGSSLWALWLNGTSGPCTSGAHCATGPFLRHLPLSEGQPAALGEWSTPEVNLTGDGPITAGLFCHEATDSASVMWMEHWGMQFQATITTPGLEASAGPDRPSPAAWARLGDTVDGERASLAMHRAGVGVLLTTDRHGLLEVRLLDYSESSNDWIEYPKRKVQYGARLSKASWAEDSEGRPTALLLCWSTGSEMQMDGPSEFICAQRRLQWLREPEGLELGSKLALVVMLALVCFFCCFKQCTQHGAPARRPARRLDIGGGRRRTSRTVAEQSRLRELRVQLAAIPDEPPRLPPANNSDSGISMQDVAEVSSDSSAGDVPRRSESGRSWSDVCGICQEDVVVRVALQRCGHTACRDCARRLLDMNQKCHICRGDIEGFLPVYL